MFNVKLNNPDFATLLDETIKEAFSFPSARTEYGAPEKREFSISGTTFHLNGYLVVLHKVKLSPGLTFRVVEVNTGDLNEFTQNVKFEVDIPTINGSFYAINDKNVECPEYIEGTFEINYSTAMAKGITNYFLDDSLKLLITNMVMDFEFVEKPKVILKSDKTDSSIGPFETEGTVNGSRVAEVLWPILQSKFYLLLRSKIFNYIIYDMPGGQDLRRVQYIFHEKYRRRKFWKQFYDMITKVKISLRKKTNGGRIKMPDIDMIVTPIHKPESWGRFKATDGWLGNIASVIANERVLGRVKINSHFEYLAVHARSQNELQLIAQIKFNDWRYCYDEYTLETNHGNKTGEIIKNFDQNEAFIVITAIRNDEGKTIEKHVRFEYIEPPEIKIDITGIKCDDWLKEYVNSWMAGLMDEEKLNIKKMMTDCINEALVDFDLFAHWDEFVKAEVDKKWQSH